LIYVFEVVLPDDLGQQPEEQDRSRAEAKAERQDKTESGQTGAASPRQPSKPATPNRRRRGL
jgi:hypothetical protein